MSFNYPWLFWLGLTLPAILALYILRPRRKQMMVPSTMLWQFATADLEANRPWRKLQSRLLLWLQLLVAACLVLAAVGLVWLAPTSTRSAVVLMDISASMRAKEGSDTRFDLAKNEVIALTEGLRGGATITVIAFDQKPKVIVRDAKNTNEVRRALNNISPSAQAADLTPALALAQAIVKQNKQARVVLISDGRIENLKNADFPIDYIPVGQGDANVAIAALNLRVGDMGQAAQVTVINHGSRPASGFVTLTGGKYPAGNQKWQLEPGQAQQLLWPNLPKGVTVMAELKCDHPDMDLLELDNKAWATTGYQSKRKVLLVTDGNIFLEKALSLIPRTEIYLADRARYELLLHSGVYPYDVTVLDGLTSGLTGLSPPAATLWINPPAGDKLPGINIGATVDAHALVAKPNSPLLAHVDLAEVNIREARAIQTGAGWQADLTANNKTIFAHGEIDGKRLAVWSVNLHQSDLPLRPAFPVLMQNTLDLLHPPGLGIPSQIKPGDEVKITPPPLTTNVFIEGQGHTWEFAPPYPPPPWVATEPGLYKLIIDQEGGGAVYELAVNGYQAAVSQIQVQHPQQAMDKNNETVKPAKHKPNTALPLSQWLALAALLVMMLEWGVASRGH